MGSLNKPGNRILIALGGIDENKETCLCFGAWYGG